MGVNELFEYVLYPEAIIFSENRRQLVEILRMDNCY